MKPKPFLIQRVSSILLGANSTARSVAKTHYSAVNWFNSQKSSCPKNWRPKHSEDKDLPQQNCFTRLGSEKKHFIDPIKLIAYRAETALAQLAREKIKRLDEARPPLLPLLLTNIDTI